MCHRLNLALGVALTIVLLPCVARSASAQAQTTGSIVGRVTDESGAVLPGVTVTATSPALLVPEIAVTTDAQGDYRIAPLPIGTYQVQYTLGGFQTLRRDNLRLTAGFIARLDVALKLGAIEESIVVSATPTIDVQSTGPATVLTKETLEIIPSSRSGIISLLNQSPSVRAQNDVGGSQTHSMPAMRVYGISAQANSWLVLEGVVATDAGQTGGGGSYFDYATFEEARMQTIANDVETPNRGVNLNLLVKSGGDEFHGGAFWEQTNHSFQWSNVTDQLATQGIRDPNKLLQRYFGGGDLGGRAIRNKLWFYSALHTRRNEVEALGVFLPDGSVQVVEQSQLMRTNKVTYQMTRSQKLVFFDYQQYLVKDDPMTALQSWETKQNNDQPQHTNKLEWQGVRGSSLVTSFQVSRWRSHVTHNIKGTGPETIDIGSQQTSGSGFDAGNIVEHWRPWATRATLGWYRPDFFFGSHDFKAGYDDVKTTSGRGWISRAGTEVAVDYALRFNNGRALDMIIYNAPNFPRTTVHSSGVYAADQWSIGRQLTLNLGLRWARDDGYVPEQCREGSAFKDTAGQSLFPARCNDHVQGATQYSLSPRLYFAYDVMGNGRTAVKGGWGRFADWRNGNQVLALNPNVALQRRYVWRDLNGDRDYDAGEVDLDVNGSDFIEEVGRGNTAIANTVVNLDQPQTKEDQLSLSLEHELRRDFAVRVTGIHSRRFDVVLSENLLRGPEVYTVANTRPDPGPDGRVGTSDDPGQFLTWFEYPAQYRAPQFQVNRLVGNADATAYFKTVEMSAMKRLMNGWQVLTSYSATKVQIPVPEGANINPNTYILSANNTWEWLFRASGAYVFPRNVMVSVNLEHRSGDVQARTVSLTGGGTIPSISLRAEPIGSLRLPHQNTVDLRASKRFNLGEGRNIEVQANLFNVGNANTVTGRSVQSGANFLRPTAIQDARIFVANVGYTF
jgi:hypothetical protein